MEFAKYFLNDYPNIPKEIQLIVNQYSATNIHTCIPEYETPLYGKGNGRNHDLAMFATDLFVGVEAKVDESFDVTILEALQNASNNKMNRIRMLCELVFGKQDFKQLTFRYQLLTATAGVLLEAKRLNVSKAILLIVELKTNGNYQEANIIRNQNDLELYFNYLKDNNSFKDANQYPTYNECNHIELFIHKIII